ncbi:hypothetical protein J6P52_01440 [bacterium]|nr:hypothetical protein [bacterium]
MFNLIQLTPNTNSSANSSSGSTPTPFINLSANSGSNTTSSDDSQTNNTFTVTGFKTTTINQTISNSNSSQKIANLLDSLLSQNINVST